MIILNSNINNINHENHIISVLYSATGNKLRETFTNYAGEQANKIDYVGPFVFHNGTLDHINTDYGRISVSSKIINYDLGYETPVYTREYDITDHQGSVRATLDDKGNNIQEGSYYAFGMTISVLTHFHKTYNPILFQSKPLTLYGDIGFQDFGSRWYDPVLGRWHAVDPALQFANPYLAMGNRADLYDPNGEFIDLAILIPTIIGALAGGYIGASVANKSFDPSKWKFDNVNTWIGLFGGALVGGFSGFVGASIATSGVTFSGTLSMIGSSAISSAGNGIINTITTGEAQPFSISFGFGSISFSSNGIEFGYLGKEGNSESDNIGYVLGALGNFSDIIELRDNIRITRNKEMTPEQLKQYNRNWKLLNNEMGKYVGSNGKGVTPKLS